ncbi:uncharacterized protein ARMOST_22051 [Armillaria ostoyae]|uniref:Uncharacterized protein n=1 Tax=Armillaria ostoyae TaxID=47428 RepID=A0A284SBS5_ARMOS|nr:uncharacterized protein ARMOST_22051 [Armillaria ostoyae]
MPGSQRRGRYMDLDDSELPPTPVNECSPSQFLGPKRYTRAVVDHYQTNPTSNSYTEPNHLIQTHTPRHVLALLGLHKDNAHTLDSSDAQPVEIPGTTTEYGSRFLGQARGRTRNWMMLAYFLRSELRVGIPLKTPTWGWRMHWRTSRPHRLVTLVSSSSFRERFRVLTFPSKMAYQRSLTGHARRTYLLA